MPGPFPHLAKPLALGGTTLGNRIVFGAHAANMAEGGLPGARHKAYCEARTGFVAWPGDVCFTPQSGRDSFMCRAPASRSG